MSLFKNENKVVMPFIAIVWLSCSAVAWTTKVLGYDIGIIGVICWFISLFGIAAFVIIILRAVLNY